MATTEGMLGQASMLGISSETTWGSLVSPAYWTPVVRNTIARERVLRDAPHLGGIALSTVNAVAPVPRDFATVADNVGGDIEIIPTYDHKSTSLFLVHCFGAAPAQSGSGPYTYTYQLGLLPGSTHAGMSLHSLHGHHSSMDPLEQFVGCMVSRFEFSVKAGDYMRLMASIIGKTSAGMVASAGTPAMLASEEILAHHVGALSWNSLTIQLNSMKIAVDKKLVRRPQLGSLLTDKPQPSALYETTFEAEVDLVSSDGYAAYLAETQADGTITCTGTGNNAMTFTLPNMVITGYSKPIDKAGVLVQRIRGKCYGVSAGTELGLKLALTNDNNAAV